MTDPYDAIYLSPHLDDAILSCGGQIHRRTRAGERVLVVTLLTADFVPEGKNVALDEVLRMMGLSAQEAMAVRRREDAAACAVLDAELVHAGLPEALVREDARGRPIYPSVDDLFGRVAFGDYPFVNEVAAALAGLPEAEQIFAPLGVGGHVDHQVVRRAAEDVFGSAVRCYEDFPYVAWKPLAVERVLGLRKKGWTSGIVPLAPEDLDARIESIGAYATQIPPLFKSEAGIRKTVERWVHKVGGERFWRRA